MDWLDHLRLLTPPQQMVVVGAGNGGGAWVQWLLKEGAPDVVLVEGDDASYEALLTATASRDDWNCRHEVVAATAGTQAFHTFSVAAESGLLPLEALRSLWPNLNVRQVQQKEAVTLAHVLSPRRNNPSNWLVIDCWPAMPLLRSLDQEALQGLDVVVLRTWLAADPPSALAQQSLNTELQGFGFKVLETISNKHPGAGHTLAWRDLRVTELSAKASAVEINRRADALAAELDTANSAVFRLNEELAKRQAALELGQAELAQLRTLHLEQKAQLHQLLATLALVKQQTEIQAQLTGQKHAEATAEGAAKLAEDILLPALQVGFSQLHSKQQEAMKETENRLLADTNKALSNAVRQIEAFIGIQSFMTTGESLANFHGWPISPDLGIFLLNRIKNCSYDVIIEFGSGTSTLLFSKALSVQIRDGREPENWQSHPLDKRLMSFEHDLKYHGDTRRLLESNNGAAAVDLIHAPLVDWNDGTGSYLFYDCDASLQAVASRLGDERARILVLVDGPPGKICANARYPAVPHIFNRLGRHHIDLVLDDANRSDEKAVIELWRTFWKRRAIRVEESTAAFEKGLYLAST